MISYITTKPSQRIWLSVLFLLLTCGMPLPARAGEDVLFQDFEEQDTLGWTATGNAFKPGPVEGTLPNQSHVVGYHGTRLVNSFRGGDATKGEFWSPTFTISHRYIRLLVGGGNKPGQCEVRLRINGVVCCTSTGRDSEELLPEWWDVSEWKGQQARIGIIDQATGGWGHILADCILFTDGPHALQGQTPPAEEIVFEDFEVKPNPLWEPVGYAFSEGPVSGTLPGQNRVVGFEGTRLVNSFLGGDGARGELRSQPFTITKHYIKLLVGGGNKPNECAVELVVGREVRCTSTGRDSEILWPAWWDVSEWQGQKAHIRIIDYATGGWGHILVDSITFTDTPQPSAAGPAPLATHRRHLFVPLRFSDTQKITPHPPGYYEAFTGWEWPGISGYYSENSYGQVDFEGSRVWDYVNLPLPARSYQSRDLWYQVQGKMAWDFSKLLNAFAAQVGHQVDFSQWDGVMFFPNVLDQTGGGAATWVPFARDGCTGLYAVAWLNPTQGHSVLAHELGHHLGIGHINGENPWSAMAWWGENDSVFGGMAVHHAPFHKLKKHWYSPWQIYTALPDTDQVITLERSALPTNDSDARVIVIPLGNEQGRYYTIEARKRAGYDRTLLCEGVAVSDIDEERSDRETSVVYPTSTDPSKPEQAAWQPGTQFTDAAYGITVEVLESTATGYVVRVRVEP